MRRPCGFIRNYISSSLSNNNNVEPESIKKNALPQGIDPFGAIISLHGQLQVASVLMKM